MRGERWAGKLRARIVGRPAELDSNFDPAQARQEAPGAPGAPCLAGTPRPGSVGQHVLDMLSGYHGRELRMHCILLGFGPYLAPRYSGSS